MVIDGSAKKYEAKLMTRPIVFTTWHSENGLIVVTTVATKTAVTATSKIAVTVIIKPAVTVTIKPPIT